MIDESPIIAATPTGSPHTSDASDEKEKGENKEGEGVGEECVECIDAEDHVEEIEEHKKQKIKPPAGRSKFKYWVEGISKHDEDFKKPHHLRNGNAGKNECNNYTKKSAIPFIVKSVREKLGVFMESHSVQVAVLALTVLDLIVIGVDLFLEEHFKKCDAEGHEVHHHGEERAEVAEEVLGWISVAILCVLGFEILLIAFAFSWRFFKHPFYVLDAVVIALSLVFELHFKDQVGTLLVVFRLWRLVRVAHGVAMAVEEREEEKIHKLQKKNKKLMSILRKWKKEYSIVEPYELEEGHQHKHKHAHKSKKKL